MPILSEPGSPVDLDHRMSAPRTVRRRQMGMGVVILGGLVCAAAGVMSGFARHSPSTHKVTPTATGPLIQQATPVAPAPVAIATTPLDVASTTAQPIGSMPAAGP